MFSAASRSTLALVLLLAGCAAGPKPEPVNQSTVAQHKRPASELIVRGREAAARAVRAEQYLSLAIAEGAERSVALPMLLQACLRSSHLQAALNHAAPYLLDHPEAEPLRYLVATIHLGLGQAVTARRELGLLLQRNDSNPEAHYLLGIIDSAGNLAAARAHFLEVLRHSKDDDQKIEVQSRLA